jgi:gibberellin 2-oxidase
MSTDVLDNVESVNIPKFIPHYENEPFHPFFNPYKAEIEAFSRVRHLNPFSPMQD